MVAVPEHEDVGSAAGLREPSNLESKAKTRGEEK